MIVVSDTSPLNYLVLINAIDVLPRLFEAIYVPPSVITGTDLRRACARCGAKAPLSPTSEKRGTRGGERKR